jgi:hypothetical protein
LFELSARQLDLETFISKNELVEESDKKDEKGNDNQDRDDENHEGRTQIWAILQLSVQLQIIGIEE